MRNQYLTSVLLLASFSVSAQLLSVKDIQSFPEYSYTYVQTAEILYGEANTEFGLYEVRYQVEGDCAPYGEVDYCELIDMCERVWVNQVDKKLADENSYTCETDISDILQ